MFQLTLKKGKNKEPETRVLSYLSSDPVTLVNGKLLLLPTF